MALSNWLTDQQLRELLQRYFDGGYHEEDGWPTRLRTLVERAQREILNSEALESLSDETFVERLVAVYRDAVRVPMYYKAIVNHPQQVRAAVSYLLKSEDDLSTMANALLSPDGAHNRKGLGKSFWAVFLMALNPEHNPYWTNKTDEALEALGMAGWSSQDSPGEVYRRIAEAEQALAALHSQADLYNIDHFMHYLKVLEGHEILEEWRGVGRGRRERVTDPWARQIATWRAEHLPPERIATRMESEAEARELLENNLGQFDEEILRRFFELINADLWEDQLRRNRFSPAFAGANVNRLAEQLEQFNAWSIRLWEASPDEVETLLDTFWQQKAIAYAGTSVPTLILYLHHPLDYNIWLPATAQGLERITGVSVGRESGAGYARFNEAAVRVRERFDLQPQEMDVILVLAGREEEVREEPGEPPTTGAFDGFRPDTFTFLQELAKNNSFEWMNANKERYKQVLREPLRALFKDVAPAISRRDPDLETEAKFGKVMATIKKRFADEEGDYHTHLWGAFYRASRSKQTDAQLYVIVHPHRLSVGVGAGQGARDVLECFRNNIEAYPETFFDLLQPLLANGFQVCTYEAHGAKDHEAVSFTSPADVHLLAGLEFIDIERHYLPDDQRLYRPDFATEVGRLFEELYPLYRFFVSEELATEEPDLVAEVPAVGIEEEEKYLLSQLQTDTFLDTDLIGRLETLLLDKGQIVLYGPPGTGKTYVAKAFARYFTDQTGGEVRIIQFHPSYAYEEFVEGIRPQSEGGQLTYPVEAGLFRRLCDEARRQPDRRYVLIVDEINRGNLPRIFGELLYLLEYRNDLEPVVLPYSRKRFSIPGNVYLIGTMNTADRSIALVDHALRRRFHFVPLKPDPEILRLWLEVHERETMAWVADLLKEVNHRLQQDQVDWHLHIGHSHWMVRDGELTEERAALIWEHSVRPTLEEYFYNRADRLARYDYATLRALIAQSE